MFSVGTLGRTFIENSWCQLSELQKCVTGWLADLPGEFCGEEVGEQRGEKLKPGWMG